MNWLKSFSILGFATIASTAIAQSASAQFVVFVAGNDPATIQRVRLVSPDAFPTRLNDQPIVQAGTFNSENSADTLAIALQQSGLSAQKYFRSSGGKGSNVQVPFPETSSIITTLPSPQQVVIQPFPSNVSIEQQVAPQSSQSSAFRYVAAVPSTANNQFLLSRVRQYVPGAFFANSGRGAYINAGAYQNRDSAESISRYLRSQGLDSRVLYF